MDSYLAQFGLSIGNTPCLLMKTRLTKVTELRHIFIFAVKEFFNNNLTIF